MYYVLIQMDLAIRIQSRDAGGRLPERKFLIISVAGGCTPVSTKLARADS